MTPRHPSALLPLVTLMILVSAVPGFGQDAPEDLGEGEIPQVSMEELAAPPTISPASIQASRLEGPPAAGRGRMTLALGGNRRWCTFPDDRVIQQPGTSRSNQPGVPKRDKVFTYGYQFTVAAVERSRPAETLMLFESPVFRTAFLRPAGKLGRGTPKAPTGPSVGARPDQMQLSPGKESPSTMVPFWQEQYRCTTVPEAFDFDLEPGTYDVYMAFDILLPSGSWTHRSIGFATDIPVAEAQVTTVEGRVEMLAGGRRTVDLLGAVSPAAPGAAPAP